MITAAFLIVLTTANVASHTEALRAVRCQLEQDQISYVGNDRTVPNHMSARVDYTLNPGEPSVSVKSAVASAKFTNGDSANTHIVADANGMTMTTKSVGFGGFERTSIIHFNADGTGGVETSDFRLHGKLLQHTDGTLTCSSLG